jgi:hypothetical protein
MIPCFFGRNVIRFGSRHFQGLNQVLPGCPLPSDPFAGFLLFSDFVLSPFRNGL